MPDRPRASLRGTFFRLVAVQVPDAPKRCTAFLSKGPATGPASQGRNANWPTVGTRPSQDRPCGVPRPIARQRPCVPAASHAAGNADQRNSMIGPASQCALWTPPPGAAAPGQENSVTGFLSAGSDAVDMTSITTATDKNLRAATRTQKHSARNFIDTCGSASPALRITAFCDYQFWQYSAHHPLVISLRPGGLRKDGIPRSRSTASHIPPRFSFPANSTDPKAVDTSSP
jgi:hypothetical protein